MSASKQKSESGNELRVAMPPETPYRPDFPHGRSMYHLAEFDHDRRGVFCGFQHWERGSSEPQHRHDCFELNFIVRGSGVNIIDNRRYPAAAGELYTLRRGATHAFYTGTGLDFYNLLFDLRMFSREEQTLLRRLDGFRALFLTGSARVEKLDLPAATASAVRKKMEQLAALQNDSTAGSQLEAKATFLLLLLQLCRCADEIAPAETVSKEYRSPELSLMLDYIHRNFTRQISVEQLASVSGLSSGYAGNYFRVHTGTTTGRYIRSLRVELAKELFERTPTLKIEEAARRCGFDSANYFSRVFRQHTGGAPEQFRARCAEKRPATN